MIFLTALAIDKSIMCKVGLRSKVLLKGARTWNLSHTQPTTSSIHTQDAIAAGLTYTANSAQNLSLGRSKTQGFRK